MSIFSDRAFTGEHVLITGATGGIGSSTAKTLAGMGASVTLTGRNEEKLTKLERSLQNEYPHARIVSFRADVGNEEDREQLVIFAEQQNGPVSMLVNNAGIYEYAKTEDVTEHLLDQMMHVNFTSAVLLTQRVYEGMKKQGKGSIVNVASLSGLRGGSGNTAYASSKFALVGFTHCLAVEAIQYGIRVNAVCPGFVDTTMGHHVINEKAGEKQLSYDQHFEAVEKGIPSGRITTPQEVANSIAFLLSEASANIVGESLKISGGSVLR